MPFQSNKNLPFLYHIFKQKLNVNSRSVLNRYVACWQNHIQKIICFKIALVSIPSYCSFFTVWGIIVGIAFSLVMVICCGGACKRFSVIGCISDTCSSICDRIGSCCSSCGHRIGSSCSNCGNRIGSCCSSIGHRMGECTESRSSECSQLCNNAMHRCLICHRDASNNSPERVIRQEPLPFTGGKYCQWRHVLLFSDGMFCQWRYVLLFIDSKYCQLRYVLLFSDGMYCRSVTLSIASDGMYCYLVTVCIVVQ